MGEKHLKREIQELKVTVRVGHNGIKESVILEIIDQLKTRSFIKIKANKGVLDATTRKDFWNDLANKTGAIVISQKGNVAIFKNK
ncbi:MAG TPA: YhbY family RNA-binding protein [Candidatus Poseidoniaceae archaeon]|jgi:RNA-binding protein YhbY|nr:YhbY family RNA-binding protein [Candidatus Poseidoniaceae archaeon]